MPELVADCPRCGSNHITFDIQAAHHYRTEYDWKAWYEAFGLCRRCSRSTVFVLAQSLPNRDLHHGGIMTVTGTALNGVMTVEAYISLKDRKAAPPPDHVPEPIAGAFKEGATCRATDCYNAAGTMFRLCVDLATRPLLPAAEPPVPGLNGKTRRELGLRLPWLFQNKLLPEALHDLAACIKEDGNDGAHAGTLTGADVEDLLDFTTALLERLYTEPEQLRLAKLRRDDRRKPPKPVSN